MQDLPSFHSIDLKNISFSDEWSLHPFISSDASTRLSSSIQRIGLLQPPILWKQSSGQYQLLCGLSRLRAFAITHPEETSICCLILEEATSPQQILYYILEDQLLSGHLSPMEKAYFFHYCLKHMGVDAAAKSFLPILGEKVQIHTINTLIKLLKLEPELQQSVHNETIGIKTALEMLLLSSTERITLHTLFLNLELGGGKQKRLLALSKDLAFREEKSITALLSESDFRDILCHPEMNQPQKAANLFTIMQKRLFPLSDAAERNFLKKIKKMELPSSCTVSHSQAFETDEVAITLHFKTLSEIEKHVSEIKNLQQS